MSWKLFVGLVVVLTLVHVVVYSYYSEPKEVQMYVGNELQAGDVLHNAIKEQKAENVLKMSGFTEEQIKEMKPKQ
jgi:hypothetical protein